jgi:hypothetical protein
MTDCACGCHCEERRDAAISTPEHGTCALRGARRRAKLGAMPTPRRPVLSPGEDMSAQSRRHGTRQGGQRSTLYRQSGRPPTLCAPITHYLAPGFRSGDGVGLHRIDTTSPGSRHPRCKELSGDPKCSQRKEKAGLRRPGLSSFNDWECHVNRSLSARLPTAYRR